MSKKSPFRSGVLLVPVPRKSLSAKEQKSLDALLERAESEMAKIAREPANRTRKSRWGLPKNLVENFTDLPLSKETRRWLKARDKYDGLMLDALDAREAGLITPKQLKAEQDRIRPLFQKAQKEFDRCYARDARRRGSN